MNEYLDEQNEQKDESEEDTEEESNGEDWNSDGVLVWYVYMKIWRLEKLDDSDLLWHWSGLVSGRTQERLLMMSLK